MTGSPRYPESGSAYRAARDQAGITQEALADAVEISLRHIKRIERGQNRPYRGLRDRIAEVLGVDSSLLPSANDAPFRCGA